VCVTDPVPFAPLLWSFRDYVVCMRHMLLMQSRCGKCHREERHLLMRSNPVACAWCATPLSRALRQSAEPPARTVAVARALRLFHEGDLGGVARASEFSRALIFGPDSAA
jgi:hypothetical protein